MMSTHEQASKLKGAARHSQLADSTRTLAVFSVWHDSYKCVTWLIYKRVTWLIRNVLILLVLSQYFTWHDAFTPRQFYACRCAWHDMTHSHFADSTRTLTVFYVWFIYTYSSGILHVTCLIYVRDMTWHIHTWPILCVLSRYSTCDMSHLCAWHDMTHSHLADSMRIDVRDMTWRIHTSPILRVLSTPSGYTTSTALVHKCDMTHW